MNIQVPWKMRLRRGPQGGPMDRNWRARRTFQDDLDVAKRPTLMVEDDLDHLGSLHKRGD